MIVLALDASTYVGTAAVFAEGRLLGAGQTAMRGRESERLFPLVLAVLRDAGQELADVKEVWCGAGPGSFTSLRIAASIAKGLAVGRGIPVRPLSSLGLIVAANAPGEQVRYLAALDALRGQHYVQQFDCHGDAALALGEPVLAPSDRLEELASGASARLVGPGLHDGWLPHVRGAMRLPQAPPVDLAAWEPDYGRKAEAQSRWEAEHGRTLPL